MCRRHFGGKKSILAELAERNVASLPVRGAVSGLAQAVTGRRAVDGRMDE